MIKRIKDYVPAKNYVFVKTNTSVEDAVKEAEKNNLGGVLVEDKGEVVGIFTENDLSRKVVAKGKDVKKTTMADVMTKNPICVDWNTDVDTCMFMMMRNNFRHIPVRDNDGKIFGVAAVRDVLKAKIEEIQEMSEASNIFEASNLVDTSGVKQEADVITKITKEYQE
jgi:CBS domain-containing protein